MFAIRHSRTKSLCLKSRGHQRWLNIFTFALVSLVAHAARAQLASQASVANQSGNPTASSNSSTVTLDAESALEEGRQLMMLGMHVDAMVQFQRSLRLHPTANATFLIGMCEGGIGHDTRARMYLRRALVESPPLEPLNQGLATRTLDRINARLGRLHIAISETNALIRVDGRPLERDDVIDMKSSSNATWVAGTSDLQTFASTGARVFDVLVDPGEHRLEVAADGFDSVFVVRNVRPAEAVSVNVKLVPSALRIRREAEQRAAEKTRRTRRSVGGILAGVGGSAVLVGGGLGIAAWYRNMDVERNCARSATLSVCNDAGKEAHEKTQDLALATNIGIASGIGLGAVGVWLFASARHSNEVAKGRGASFGLQAFDITMGVGNNETRVLLTGSF